MCFLFTPLQQSTTYCHSDVYFGRRYIPTSLIAVYFQCLLFGITLAYTLPNGYKAPYTYVIGHITDYAVTLFVHPLGLYFVLLTNLIALLAVLYTHVVMN